LLLLKLREINLILNLCAHENIGKIIFFIKLKFIIGVATLLCIENGLNKRKTKQNGKPPSLLLLPPIAEMDSRPRKCHHLALILLGFCVIPTPSLFVSCNREQPG
jgi:hypothetical protein